jgi:hypothetical protein
MHISDRIVTIEQTGFNSKAFFSAPVVGLQGGQSVMLFSGIALGNLDDELPALVDSSLHLHIPWDSRAWRISA